MDNGAHLRTQLRACVTCYGHPENIETDSVEMSNFSEIPPQNPPETHWGSETRTGTGVRTGSIRLFFGPCLCVKFTLLAQAFLMQAFRGLWQIDPPSQSKRNFNWSHANQFLLNVETAGRKLRGNMIPPLLDPQTLLVFTDETQSKQFSIRPRNLHAILWRGKHMLLIGFFSHKNYFFRKLFAKV